MVVVYLYHLIVMACMPMVSKKVPDEAYPQNTRVVCSDRRPYENCQKLPIQSSGLISWLTKAKYEKRVFWDESSQTYHKSLQTTFGVSAMV